MFVRCHADVRKGSSELSRLHHSVPAYAALWQVCPVFCAKRQGCHVHRRQSRLPWISFQTGKQSHCGLLRAMKGEIKGTKSMGRASKPNISHKQRPPRGGDHTVKPGGWWNYQGSFRSVKVWPCSSQQPKCLSLLRCFFNFVIILLSFFEKNAFPHHTHDNVKLPSWEDVNGRSLTVSQN